MQDGIRLNPILRSEFTGSDHAFTAPKLYSPPSLTYTHPARKQIPIGLELAVLAARYRDEMGSTVIAPRRIEAQFLVAIERLFRGRVEDIARQLRASRDPRG